MPHPASGDGLLLLLLGMAQGETPAGDPAADESGRLSDRLVDWVGDLGEWTLNVGGKEVGPADLVVALVLFLLAFPVSRVLQRLVERGLRRIHVESEGSIGTATRIVHYSTVLLGLVVSLRQLGIELQTLLTAGAIFAVAFGFAMQNIAQNFVSGVILLLERSIKAGDVLEIEGEVVRVVEMGIRATVVRTLNEEEMIVPNSILVQNTVKNYTLRDNLFRLRSTVGVSYGSDMRRVAQALEEMAAGLEWREKERAPRIFMVEFGNSSVVWEVSVWIRNPWMAQRLGSLLNEAIWSTLADAGITIAFPQLDLHLDQRAERVLAGISAHGDGFGA